MSCPGAGERRSGNARAFFLTWAVEFSALQGLRTAAADVRIVSDANTFFIDEILKSRGIHDVFTEIVTNPAVVQDGEGVRSPGLCELGCCCGSVVHPRSRKPRCFGRSPSHIAVPPKPTLVQQLLPAQHVQRGCGAPHDWGGGGKDCRVCRGWRQRLLCGCGTAPRGYGACPKRISPGKETTLPVSATWREDRVLPGLAAGALAAAAHETHTPASLAC